MKRFNLALCCGLLLPLALGACNGDDNDDDQADIPSTAGNANLLPAPIPGARGANNPPDPGDRIDRAGRPAIGAALISTFTADPDVKRRETADYNSSGLSNVAFTATMKTSLGILDGLDGNCGNQLLAAAEGDRYGMLSQVLLDDQLYLNSARPGSVYLGVEAEAVGAVMPGQGAGGGRQPGDDVVDRSYSVLAAGALGGVTDGVDSDDTTPDPRVFPFLAAPQ
ncbi:MAG TPA: hypothetical protein VFS67_28330 [Polyangiaceae bacterium]|jgi:hypothetical protein|nr:hypothetical protein [Polyangiaceae bacterium]